MKYLVMALGVLVAAFGVVDVVGSNFMGFDLWWSMGIELPELLWRYSSYIEMTVGVVLFQAGRSMQVASADAASVTSANSAQSPYRAPTEPVSRQLSLIYKNEPKLFLIAAIYSGIVWLLLIVLTVGIALVFIILFALFSMVIQSAFISYLQGTGVKINQDQYPDLHKKLLAGCERVGLAKVPDAYLLRAGAFNALATRFLGRHYVVLFTDVVDALHDQSGAMDFYIGHELGHIHREHLMWSVFLLPASVLPLLGAALRRAEEYTCDRYGVACCASESDINAALAALAAGDTRWKSINMDSYVRQVEATKGFWMSFNELISDYPWFTKRAVTSIFYHRGQEIKLPRRHTLAWILAAFVPRIGGGMASLPLTLFIVGILMVSALPAFNDYVDRLEASTVNLPAQVMEESVSSDILRY